MNDLIKVTEDIYEIEESVRHKHKSISNIPTPFHQVKKKGGFDYVEEGYMRNVLNKSFPIWNWDEIGPLFNFFFGLTILLSFNSTFGRNGL